MNEIWIIYLCVNYFCLAWIVTIVLDVPSPRVPPYFISSFINASLPIGAITIVLVALRSLWMKVPKCDSTVTVESELRRLGWGILIGLLMLVFLGAFSTWKNAMSVVANFTWDSWLADLDAALHAGNDAWRLYVPIAEMIPLSTLEMVYMGVWITLAGALPVSVLLLERNGLERRRFFICFFAIWIFLGNIMALSVLSAGPVYFVQLTGDHRFQPLLEWLQNHAADVQFTVQVQKVLWQAQVTGDSFLGSGISAFPSVHVGMATLTMLYLMRRLGPFGWVFGLPYLVLIQIGSVVFAWHYAIDGYFSIVLVWVIWRLTAPSDIPENRTSDGIA